jgi:short-subunit dehydrogenase
MKLDGARVLITGATGGIGEAIALAVAARGAEVVLHGRRRDAVEALAERLGGRSLVADLANRQGVLDFLGETGDLDVVVANAALPGSGALLDFSVEQIDRAIDVNLRAPIVMARLAVERMAARRRGHLVFVNSLAGKVASNRISLYNATKFGLRGFAQSLRAEFGDQGVGVSTVFPGFVRDAGMFAKSGAVLPRGIGTRTPRDVARAVVRAVEHDVAEIDVAPMSLRLATAFGVMAPRVAARAQRLVGADKVVEQIAEGQYDMR